MLGMGGKLKAGNTIHNEADSSNVFSVGHRNSHSQPGRPRRSLQGVPYKAVALRCAALLFKDNQKVLV